MDIDKIIEKALSTGTGEGADFLDDETARFFIEKIQEQIWCRSVFRSIPMASKTLNIPKILTNAKVYYESTENTNAVSTGFTTGTVQLIAKKFMSRIDASEEAYEDWTQSVQEIINNSFVNRMARAEEEAILIGDTDHATTETEASATSALWYAKDHKLVWDGILTIGTDDSDAATPVDATAVILSSGDVNTGGDLTPEVVAEALYNLGDYADDASRLFMFLNRYTGNRLRTNPELLTVDKYGQMATVLNPVINEIGSYMGIRTVISSFVTNAYGVITHRDNGIIGDRRKIKIKTAEWIDNDSRKTVVTERLDFAVENKDAIVAITDLRTPVAAS